jgi:hypothetical protein
VIPPETILAAFDRWYLYELVLDRLHGGILYGVQSSFDSVRRTYTLRTA